MVFIYVLKLSNNKFYVGKTSNPNIRIQNHFSQNIKSSAWTKLHKPIKIMELIANCDEYDEDKYTLKYMNMYGIASVRGGCFSHPVLTSNQIYFIQQILRSINNECLYCGKQGHFVKECPIKISVKQPIKQPIRQQNNNQQNDNQQNDNQQNIEQLSIFNYFFNLLENFIYPEINSITS